MRYSSITQSIYNSLTPNPIHPIPAGMG